MAQVEKIRWNIEEATAVVNSAKQFWASAPGMTMLEAVRGGQNALPKERRRALTGSQQISPTVKMLLDQFVAAGGLETKPVETEPAPAPSPVAPAPSAPTPLEIALHALADSVAATVSERIAERIHQSLAQRLEGILQHVAQQAVQTDIQRKRKVLILGLTDYLQHPLEQEFAKVLDLRFKEPNAPMNGIVDSAKGMDFVLVTKWTGHKTSASLRSAGIEFVFVDGGIKAIKEKLTEFYVL
jgi:hypothetical protein